MMQIAMVILSAFICLWAWSENLRQLKPDNVFLPFGISFVFLSSDWRIVTAFAVLAFMAPRLIKKEKFVFYAKCFCILAVWAIGFQFFLQNLSFVSQMPEPPIWIFWLGDTGLIGIFIGFLAGFLLKLIFGERGHIWWLAPALILSGIASLGLVWALFLGDRWEPKKHVTTIFSLGGILIGLFLMSSYDPSLKWQMWYGACLVWISLETLIFRRQARN